MLNKVPIDIEPDANLPGLRVTATARVTGKTGVEMEALTAASIACLTIYDMAKAIDRGMTIGGIRLLEKSGGKSGDYRRKAADMALLPVADAIAQLLDGAKAKPMRDGRAVRKPRAACWPNRFMRCAHSHPSTPPPWTATPFTRPTSKPCRPR